MLESSRKRIVEQVAGDAAVLDVGGWADPLERADWVLDVKPYTTRGLYRREGWIDRPSEPERFTEETWVTRDLCDREPYPFEDERFDFVVCTHTLEDLRDPLWVCAELMRVGRAGYIEVPSRLEEQSWAVEGPWVGWRHHRWLIDVGENSIEFVAKDHAIHSDPAFYFPPEFAGALTDEERVQRLWWDGSFRFTERLFIDEDPRESYLPDYVRENRGRLRSFIRRRRPGGS